MTRTRRALCVVLWMLAAALDAGAASKAKPPPEPVVLTGTVSRVVDGDTLWLKTAADDKPVVIRIEGIDAPESCQPGGAEATAWLTDLALGRSVTVRVSASDDWGRTVGKVFDGTKDIGDRMVRDGQAWSGRYKYDRGPYIAEERMAQSLKRGLHAPGGAIEPREFRKRNGECAGAAGAAKPVVSLPPATTSPKELASLSYRCDGRKYCSQMTSCGEATWFLKNCPGVKMDGNHDGVPCEQQWCKR